MKLTNLTVEVGLADVSIENSVGEEAPVARAGPRSPDAFYRGEEAGAALKFIH